MTKQSTKQAINSVNKTTKLDIDLTSVLIDKTLTESASIMYIRQATYYYLLRLNGWSRKDLHKAIKQRAEVNATPYNKGVLVKESQVSLYCIEKQAALFSSVKISKTNFESIISKIAVIMQKNKLSFSYLKDILKQKTDSTESEGESEGDSAESNVDKKVKTDIDFESVVEFIKNTTQENRLNLVEVLTESIKNYVDNKEEEEESEEAAA